MFPKRIFTALALLIGLTGAAFADTVLVIGDYNNAPDSVKARLEAAGHTVVLQRDTNNPPADISTYDQIWDLRWYNSFDQTVTDQYDDFVKNGGFLFISTENPGCCNSQNATKASFITQIGGGTTTIGGTAGSTENTVVNGTNTTYMTDGLTVNFSAISAIENDQGTALITDGNGKVAAMMWVGNAGDLGTDYTGTVITIADINWLAQGFTNTAHVDDNTQALDDIIGGVVAGTVAGTITDSGNGAGSNIGGGGPTVVSTADGDPITTSTAVVGTSTITTVVTNDVSETSTKQTVVETTTVTTSTPTTTTTCTTPTTVTTYSDGTTTTTNGTETCVDTVSYAVSAVESVETFTGNIDQVSSAQDVVSTMTRNLEFDGPSVIRSEHKYDNGLTGKTTGFAFGGEKMNEEGLIVGGGLANMKTTIDDENNSAEAKTQTFVARVGREFDFGTVRGQIQRSMTDYTVTRKIGPYSNGGETDGSDTNLSMMLNRSINDKLSAVAGVTHGKRTVAGYEETGSSLTARSVAKSSENYTYGTLGGNLDLGLLDISAVHHTDGVNEAGVGIVKDTDKVTWEVRVKRSMTDLGNSNSLDAGLNIKF